jgi:hypothetical protein
MADLGFAATLEDDDVVGAPRAGMQPADILAELLLGIDEFRCEDLGSLLYELVGVVVAAGDDAAVERL